MNKELLAIEINPISYIGAIPRQAQEEDFIAGTLIRARIINSGSETSTTDRRDVATHNNMAGPGDPICLYWTFDQVADWIAELGFPQYRVSLN